MIVLEKGDKTIRMYKRSAGKENLCAWFKCAKRKACSECPVGKVAQLLGASGTLKQYTYEEAKKLLEGYNED